MRVEEVYPWGRNLSEFKSLFNLTDEDLQHPIVSFGDGTSSVNSELKKEGKSLISIDPIYQFSRLQLEGRFNEVIVCSESYTRNLPLGQQEELKEIAASRIRATADFLEDFDLGTSEQRYINASLPGPLPLSDKSFEIGLSAHFLLLYDVYGLTFHIAALKEMLRICNEVRIYPVINLDGRRSAVLDDVIRIFSSEYNVQLEDVSYGFHDMGKQMIRIFS